MKMQYVVNVSNEEDEPLVLPVMKFDKTEEKKEKSEGTVRDTSNEPLTIPTINFDEKE
jgi:hypothetical protein